jgi:hypothetical protein
MNTGGRLKTTNFIRLQKTGVLLPPKGPLSETSKLGKELIWLISSASEEYLFPNEVVGAYESRNHRS